MDETLYLLLPVLFLGTIFATVAGAGLGAIMIIACTLFLDVRTSVVVMSLMGLISQPVKIAHFWKYADWRIVKYYLILGIPLSYFGGLYLYSMPLRALEVCIAIACGLFVLVKVIHKPFRLPSGNFSILLLGGINGFIGGVVGLGGVARNPFLLGIGLTKERFLGTSSIIALLMNIGKVSAYIPNVEWSRYLIIFLIGCVPCVIGGVHIGKKCLRKVSHNTFENLLLCVILAGVVKLLLFP